MGDEAATGGEEPQQRQLRRIGYGIAIAGALSVLAATVSTRPRPIVVYGLVGLAIAVLVLESFQGSPSGLSIGLLVGSFGGWLWPQVDGGNYAVLGVTLLGAGLLNAAVTPYFRAFGERLAGR